MIMLGHHRCAQNQQSKKELSFHLKVKMEPQDKMLSYSKGNINSHPGF